MRLALATVGTVGDVRPCGALATALAVRARGDRGLVGAAPRRLRRQRRPPRAGRASTSADEIRRTATAAAQERSPIAQVAILRRFHLRDAGRHYAALREILPGHDLVLLHGIHALAAAAAVDAGLRHATAVFDPVLLPTGRAVGLLEAAAEPGLTPY